MTISKTGAKQTSVKAYLLDANILRHLGKDISAVRQQLSDTPRSEIGLPSVVVAETLRGRAEQLLKAEPDHLVHAHRLFQETQQLLLHFNVVVFDDRAEAHLKRLLSRHSSKKRYADLQIAAMVLVGGHTLVTRNTQHFKDVLPANQVVDWSE